MNASNIRSACAYSIVRALPLNAGIGFMTGLTLSFLGRYDFKWAVSSWVLSTIGIGMYDNEFCLWKART